MTDVNMKTLCLGIAVTAFFAASVVTAQAPAPGEGTEAAPPSTAAESAPKKLRYTDDYRISVDDDANSDGEIVFRVTIKDEGAKDIVVKIKKGTNENAVAREIKKAFEEQLGTRHYNIEMEDGENVIIERSGGKSNTSLVLVSNSVKNVDVKVHRD
jgi:hypothetical protein